MRRRAHTDVVFKIGESLDEIEAHRLILASASRVFDKILYQSSVYLSHDVSNDGKLILLEPESTFIPFEVFVTVNPEFKFKKRQ